MIQDFNRTLKIAACLFAALLGTQAVRASEGNLPDDWVIHLEGTWNVLLDSADCDSAAMRGVLEAGDTLRLPGTLCDGGYGTPASPDLRLVKENLLHLTPRYSYVGKAWYARTIDIPRSWKGKNVILALERVLWKSRVWVNGRQVEGEGESLSAPHRFDVTGLLAPGKRNVICVCVDNRKLYDISHNDLGHAYTNETQTMWNGILGSMTLTAYDKCYIDDFAVIPDVAAGKVRVSVRLGGSVGRNGELDFSVRTPAGQPLGVKTVAVDGKELAFDYPIADAQLWDEFSPNLYGAELTLRKGGEAIDVREMAFGMRALSAEGSSLRINGRRLFLRGTLESCVFPLAGYPPTDEAGWREVFDAARDYGLNHLRFHSWCPPEAAFRVADKMGFYLQVELPVWSLSIGKDRAVTDFLFREARRVMREYGNHPSFCFWSMGNELEGDFSVLDSLVRELKSMDNRHLYTASSFSFDKERGSWPGPADDFMVTQWTKKGWVRGQGIFDSEPATFNRDYSAAVDSLPVPMVSHEIGQYSVYPDVTSVGKYTGNLLPLNLLAIAGDLRRKGRLSMAKDYLSASGKFAALLYKEEIERALRTPGLSGFQLLGLCDYPGQGTALVGVLDEFWDSKGVVDPEAFRAYCSPVVPLALFDRAVYLDSDTLSVRFKAANFSAGELVGASPEWLLTDDGGHVYAAGRLPVQDIQLGNSSEVGTVDIPLAGISEACKLRLSFQLSGTDYRNAWNVWVYPSRLRVESKGVVCTDDFDEAENALRKGRKVLFNPKAEELNGLEGKFVPVFWSPVHFPYQPGTMGILCDPSHPALALFPTEEHSDWQWWDICKRGVTMALDSLDAAVTPLVSVIDNFLKNRSLALVFEARVGKGQLVVCGADITNGLDGRPVARQLRHSILDYMRSDAFHPVGEVTFDEVRACLYKK